MNPRTFADNVTEIIFSKKGYDVKIIDLQKLATFADYFVICSADSDTQVKAIADEIDKKLRDEGIKCWHKEGYIALQWVLLDYVDVVIHVFRKDAREFYNLEKLWSDAPVYDIEDPLLKSKKETAPVKKTTRKTSSVKKKL